MKGVIFLIKSTSSDHHLKLNTTKFLSFQHHNKTQSCDIKSPDKNDSKLHLTEEHSCDRKNCFPFCVYPRREQSRSWCSRKTWKEKQQAIRNKEMKKVSASCARRRAAAARKECGGWTHGLLTGSHSSFAHAAHGAVWPLQDSYTNNGLRIRLRWNLKAGRPGAHPHP